MSSGTCLRVLSGNPERMSCGREPRICFTSVALVATVAVAAIAAIAAGCGSGASVEGSPSSAVTAFLTALKAEPWTYCPMVRAGILGVRPADRPLPAEVRAACRAGNLFTIFRR